MARRLKAPYLDASFHTDLRGRRLPIRFTVITACNPLGKKAPLAVNRRRDAALGREGLARNGPRTGRAIQAERLLLDILGPRLPRLGRRQPAQARRFLGRAPSALVIRLLIHVVNTEEKSERVGFEPTDAFTRRQFSRLVP